MALWVRDFYNSTLDSISWTLVPKFAGVAQLVEQLPCKPDERVPIFTVLGVE